MSLREEVDVKVFWGRETVQITEMYITELKESAAVMKSLVDTVIVISVPQERYLKLS